MGYNFFAHYNEENGRDMKIFHEEVCIPSFHKYYKTYSELYGFKYLSPNKTEDSSNYGSFWDSVEKYLKETNRWEFDLRYPESPWTGMYLKGKTYIGDSVLFLDGSTLTPKISSKVKDLFNSSLHKKYVELKIKNAIKRFFLLGGIDEHLLIKDNIFKHGFNSSREHYSENVWEDNYSDLLHHHSGKYGIMYSFDKVFYSDLLTHEGNKISVPLIGLNNNKGFNKLFYFTPSHFDNIQYHKIIPTHLFNDFIDSFRDPENEIRTELGLPKIGEGWISETKLFYLIKERFKNFRVIQHGKPKWLGKQHLDIYLPDLNVGIEYQGEQHSISVEIFGGETGLKNSKERDTRKKNVCQENQLKLFEVFPDDDFVKFVDHLSNLYL
jgi:hypothetical protein